VVIEPEYEIVRFPVTQSANSAAVGMSQSRKKPKPGPKPSKVALRIAEFSLQQQMNSKGSTVKSELSRRASEPPGPAPPRPPSAASAVDSSKSTQTRSSANDVPQYANLLSSDDPFYDRAVRVKLDVLQQISGDMASADVLEKSIPTSATSDSPASGAVAKHMYSKPKKRVVVEEPIYEDANTFVSPVDEEPLYDEAIVVPLYDKANVVVSDRLPLAQLDPLYGYPAGFSDRRSQTTSTTQYSQQDNDLYDEAQPVNRMTIPRSEDNDKDEIVSVP